MQGDRAGEGKIDLVEGGRREERTGRNGRLELKRKGGDRRGRGGKGRTRVMVSAVCVSALTML